MPKRKRNDPERQPEPEESSEAPSEETITLSARRLLRLNLEVHFCTQDASRVAVTARENHRVLSEATEAAREFSIMATTSATRLAEASDGLANLIEEMVWVIRKWRFCKWGVCNNNQ